MKRRATGFNVFFGSMQKGTGKSKSVKKTREKPISCHFIDSRAYLFEERRGYLVMAH